MKLLCSVTWRPDLINVSLLVFVYGVLHVVSMPVISWPKSIYIGLIICKYSMNGCVGYLYVKGRGK